MLIIGSHVSFNNTSQLLGSVEAAIANNANAFMFYTGAPQNTQRGALNDLVTYEALKKMKENNLSLDNVVCHAPYIVNLANNIDPEKYEFTKNFLRQELDRCEQLGVKKIVLHPGSATKLDRETALNNIVKGLNAILHEDDNIVILLETMAGKGTELGCSMEELKYILEGVTLKDKVGVCLDTCHLSDSGVDISKFDEYLDLFDENIGIEKIGCVHLNDSKNPIGARKDRHENIGFGTIGFETLINVAYNPRLENVPKILETPFVDREYCPYKIEIQEIKDKKMNNNLYEDVVSMYK